MEDSGILIVDDDAGILMATEDFLSLKGISAGYAQSGEDALLKIREGHIALMITDLNMSGMDGIELSIKARELVPDMTIIMVTGDASPETLDRARMAGISKVFSKPFDLNAIFGDSSYIANYLRRCRL